MMSRKIAIALLLFTFIATAHAQQQTTTTGAANPLANTVPCLKGMVGGELKPIPEIVSSGGFLRGTLYTVSEQVMFVASGSTTQCRPQWVRAYRPDAPSSWNPPASQIAEPLPGPTLRARLGDVVQLTFLNVIDANKFPGTDDEQCDTTPTYPGTVTNPDKFPDCFAGSVFTNVHYHGTHTSPGSTADNVFVQIKPSPRQHDGTNAPIIDASSVQREFNEFFQACAQQLQLDPGPKEWPRIWSDFPAALRGKMTDWVRDYGEKGWLKTNENLIATGNWPQYFVGAYPYCFRIPRYTSATWPPAPPADLHAAHTGGAGVGEVDEAKAPKRPLVMGQSPGTHWYHAHKHGSTTINVMNGMTGAFIIEGTYDDDINRFYGANWTRKQPTLVINQLGAAPSLQTTRAGGPGPAFSVNGRQQPVIKMKAGEVQMWRIVNSSGRAGVFFAKPEALQWKQLAQDGVQFTPANYASRTSHEFLLASGNRADLLVKAPAFRKPVRNDPNLNRYAVYVYNTVDPSDRPPQNPTATKLTLLTVEVQPEPMNMEFIPEDQAPVFPPFLKDIEDGDLTGTKVMTFATQAPGRNKNAVHTIDDKQFDGELGAVVELNRFEEWKIVSKTYNGISHPFHIHLNPFQISEIFDPNATLPLTTGDGTVSVAANSLTTVQGTGTKFTKTFQKGDFIWIGTGTNAQAPVAVVDVKDDTTLTVSTAYSGALAGQTYQAAAPLYTMTKPARPEQCVLDPLRKETWKPCWPTEPPKDRIWWDVFSIPSGNTFTYTDKDNKPASVQVPGYFKMRSRFVDYAGYFVLHCHILAHEDRGMMTVVQITPVQTPYSHH